MAELQLIIVSHGRHFVGHPVRALAVRDDHEHNQPECVSLLPAVLLLIQLQAVVDEAGAV